MGKNNVLVLGSGGREHVLAWKLRQSPHVKRVYCGPGNAGIAHDAEIVPLKVDDFEGIKRFVREYGIVLTVVGPEDPLAGGIVDSFEKEGLVAEGHYIFGPSASAARLESSKIFAKEFMKRWDIPTAYFRVFEDPLTAKDYAMSKHGECVVKADGLAAGKGVVVCRSIDEAVDAIDNCMVKKAFKDAGRRIVIEDIMEGEEASMLVLTDGKNVRYLVSSQDHKPVFDNDKGPNTGGMGAYAPAPVVTGSVLEKVDRQIVLPTINGMAEEGNAFKGCLYVGLMIDKAGNPRVVEKNARFGDPEAQPVLSLLKSDLYELLMGCAQGNLGNLKIENRPGAACCVVMASGGYPGPYGKGFPIEGLNKVIGPDVYVFHAGTKVQDGRIVTSGGRILGVTAVGDDIEKAIGTAYGAVEKISWAGVHYRRDIGAKAVGR